MKAANEALSAKDIHSLLPATDLVTIYRALELFTKEKTISALHFDTSETKYEYQHTPHHHAICDNCEKIIHFDAKNEKIKQLLELDDFAIESIEVTVRGTCKNKH